LYLDYRILAKANVSNNRSRHKSTLNYPGEKEWYWKNNDELMNYSPYDKA